MDAVPWITTDQSAAAMALRAAVFVGLLFAGVILALGIRDAYRRSRRGVDAAARRALGRPASLPWEPHEWLCGACRSLNALGSERCRKCRTPRARGELRLERPPGAVDDQIPARIPAAPPSAVTLEHREAAHLDGLAEHWRLRVNGVVAGSAARRDGALALLQALDGADRVMFDPDGNGYRPFALAALVAAFERPVPPVPGPCPEAVSRG